MVHCRQPNFSEMEEEENNSITTDTVAFMWSESAFLDYKKSFSLFLSCLENVSTAKFRHECLFVKVKILFLTSCVEGYCTLLQEGALNYEEVNLCGKVCNLTYL